MRPYITVIPATPTILATIYAINKSNGTQNIKITDLLVHLLFDSSVDPASLARIDDYDDHNDKDLSLAGVHDKDTPITGVPIVNTQAVTSADEESDVELTQPQLH